MMYTSGSTGTPKGVCVTHRNVVKLVRGSDYADFDSGEVFLQFAPLSFDASTFEIWGALLNGARLVLFPAYAPTLSELGDEIGKSQVTTLWLTAGLFHQMVDGNLQGLAPVKQLLAGGEALSVGHVGRVLEALEGVRLVNGYGPTETTTFACCYAIEPGQLKTSVPIGRPITNTRVYLLNEEMRPTAVGERGEVYIGGEGLARGYLNRPDLTAERFVADPFSSAPGGRLYRTGDIARYLPGGNIEFLGRADDQVKIRGFRVELGEIEAALAEHPAVREAVLMAREDTPGDKRLVAYVVAAGGEAAPSGEELKSHVRERLPEYMVPSVCVTLEALPLTPNGKVDRRALPAPDRSLLRSERPYVAPQTEQQQRLAAIWEEILGIRPIGLRDDFFELGGHSLLVVRLIAQIEERLGKRIPISSFFEGSTVEYLDELLRKQTEAPSWSTLVPIQPNGTGRPLYCIHPAGGHVLCYADLARHLGPDQPFYGLQARGSNKDQTPHTEIGAMAADYVEAVRAFQPSGPYLLGGWSMGGIVAFEMARQLEAQGQRVSLLAVIDAEAPTEDVAEYSFAILLGSFALDLGLSFDQLTVPWEEIAALPQAGQFNCIFSEARLAGVIPPDMTLVEFRRNFDTFKTNAQMMKTYRAGSYEGRVTLFSAEKPLERITQAAPDDGSSDYAAAETQKSRNPLARWRAHRAKQLNQQEQVRAWSQFAAGGVETHTVPGDHYSIVREPNVRTLAELLRDCIANTPKES
jgi:thioesterase domain-containing protein/acyl carrier protein